MVKANAWSFLWVLAHHSSIRFGRSGAARCWAAAIVGVNHEDKSAKGGVR